MPTVKKSLAMRPVLTEDQLQYLLDGNYGSSLDKFMFSGDKKAVRSAWGDLREALLAEWVEVHPGRRPASWWTFDAPGRRLRLDGGEDWEVRGMAFKLGIPDFTFAHDYGPYAADGPFSFESEASYLDRLGLLSPGEKRRIPAKAWEPEVVRD